MRRVFSKSGAAMPMKHHETRSNADYRRSIQDYFATPAPITEALLKHETFDGLVWECACGEG